MNEFAASISLSPDNAWVYYNRAQVYDLAGDRQRALSDYEMALGKDDPALNPIRRERASARLQELRAEY